MIRKEDAEQRCFFQWLKIEHPEWHDCAFHVPNGGYRNPREAARFKKLGVKSGVADVIILKPSGNYHGFVCEMKRSGKSYRKPSPTQQLFLDKAAENGYKTCVAAGFEEAQKYFMEYIDEK